MARPPELPPESIIVGAFTGMKNTVSRERLQVGELERAVNVDIDDAGQLRRRRGYKRKLDGAWHSIRTIADRVLGVRDGTLVRILPSYSVVPLATVGTSPLAYTAVAGEVFFCNEMASGVISPADAVQPWGKTDGQGLWLSTVTDPTATLGEVAGKLLGDPIRARHIEAYKGRIYMADGKTLWATELYLYHYVDRTKAFMQFEHDITLLMAMDDGIYVGTTGGLYFIQGVLGKFQLKHINGDAVLPGSGQVVPANMVHPQARNAPMPAGDAAVFMTSSGIVAGFDGGTCFNLTQGTMVFPAGVSAASLFREDQGGSSYVAAVDSAGGPAANCRIGDYVDAEIVRRT